MNRGNNEFNQLGKEWEIHWKTNICNEEDTCQICARMVEIGKKNHGDKIIFPFCQVMEDDTTEHDHFILCPSSQNQKEERLEAFDKLLTKPRTPEDLKEYCIKDWKAIIIPRPHQM